MASMDWDDFLRHEAVMYRQLAEKTENVFGKQELLTLTPGPARTRSAIIPRSNSDKALLF
jgi:hypothetical protein